MLYIAVLSPVTMPELFLVQLTTLSRSCLNHSDNSQSTMMMMIIIIIIITIIIIIVIIIIIIIIVGKLKEKK